MADGVIVTNAEDVEGAGKVAEPVAEPVADGFDGGVDDGLDDLLEETSDPGSLDGKSKVVPLAGSKRWNEIYKKSKDSERKITELNQALGATNEVIAELRKHNKSMAKSFDEFMSSTTKTSDVNSPDAIRYRIADAVKQKADAVGEDNYKLALQLQDTISDLKGQLIDKQFEALNTQPKTNVAAANVDYQVALSTFITEAPWFDESSNKFDAAMNGAANAINRQVGRDPKWARRPLIEQYREVKRLVELRFGYDKVKTSPTVGRVSDIQRGNSGVSLSDAQRRVAANLFPDDPNAEAEYAKQLKRMNGGR